MKPFQVLCIRKGEWPSCPSLKDMPSPQYLDICTVVEEQNVKSPHWGRPCLEGVYYWFKEYPNSGMFHSSFFIRLPDLSADEMEQEQKEAIVNLELFNSKL